MSASIQNPAEQLQQAALALDAVQKALDYSLGISAEAAAQQDAVAQTLAAAGVQVMAITAITPSLEDVFIASARREG